MERENLLNEAETILMSGFGDINDEIFSQIEQTLSGLDVSGGAIMNTGRNATIINELEDRIRNGLLRTRYRENVQGYLRKFNEISAVNASFHATANQLGNVSPQITRLQNVAISNTIKDLFGQGMNEAFAGKVQENLYNYTVSGTSIQEATEELRREILGSPERLGELERHVGQVARDSISQYDGRIQAAIQAEFGLNAVSYEGSLIKDSRAQCVKWVREYGGVLTLEQLEKEVQWAERGGTYEGVKVSGWIPGTTLETFYINRGGYNCRHIATAINVEE